MPALAARPFGRGKVVYFAAAIDAALWSYAYPYQRRLLVKALEWAAREPAPIRVKAPLCVQAAYYVQTDRTGMRLVIHFFNGVDTAANHGLPAADVPLREETIPIHGIELAFSGTAPKSFHMEPGGRQVKVRADGNCTILELPALEIHAMLVAEY